ncbi:MAG: flagellar hook-length control protein FliK, partial [Candidatus Kryptoniota bacterium]
VDTADVIPQQSTATKTKPSSLEWLIGSPTLGIIQIADNFVASATNNSVMNLQLSDIPTTSQHSTNESSSSQNNLMVTNDNIGPMSTKSEIPNTEQAGKLSAAKATILKLLSDLSAGSGDKNLSDEVEKILSSLPSTISKAVNGNAQSDLSQKLPDSTAQPLSATSTLGTIQSEIPDTGQTNEISAAKAAILKLLSGSSTDISDNNFSSEVEKILSSLPNTVSKAVSDNAQSDLSQKFSDSTAQPLSVVSTLGKIQVDEVSQSQQSVRPDIIRTDSQPSTTGNQLTQNVFEKILTAQNLPEPQYVGASLTTQSGAKDSASGSASASQLAANSAEVNKVSTNNTNSVPVQDKLDTKIFLENSKDGSADSGNGLADLLRHNATDAYANVSNDSQTDVQFKQIISDITHSTSSEDVSNPNTSQVAQTIIREVNLMTQQDKTVVNVKLEPESLGSVTLKVSSVDGDISAEFNVKTPDARAYLEASIPQMKETLQNNGVSLSHLSVSLSNSDAQSKQQQYQLKKSQRANFAGKMDTISESDESTPAYGISQRSFGYNTMEVKI